MGEKFNKIPPFRKCVLQNFPFIEEDFDALTDYELLCKVVEYLNACIAVTNETSEKFVELKSYVDHYFDSLDVTQEINDKLEEMAEDGELATIISQIVELGTMFAYDTIAAMAVAENLGEGSICRVLSKTDTMTGDGSYYKIRERTNADVPDGINLVVLTNTNNLVAEIVPNYFIDDLNSKIGNLNNLTTNNKTDVVSAINEINNQIFTTSTLVDKIKDFPLLFTKRSDGVANGSLQGITAEFNSNSVPTKIYQWVDYSDYAKLYVTTCGSRTDGTGWFTSVLSSGTDQIPYSHGSALGIKDGYVLVGELGDKTFAKINTSTGSYETIDLSTYLPEGDYYVVSVIWDELTSTYNILVSDNITHYILDEQFNLVRSYTYTANGLDFSTSYSLQGYDYYNGFEYRVMSLTSGGNICLIIDTIDGKILKTYNLTSITGEIESIKINRNIALFSYNNADAYCDLINHHYITEAYIGGYPENNIKILQDYSPVLHNTNLKQGILGEGKSDTHVDIYFENNYSNSEIVRYIGDGSTTNPIKSGSALGTIFNILNELNSSTKVKVIFKTSTNTDDTGVHMVTILSNISEEDFDLNTNSASVTHFNITAKSGIIRVRKLNITTSNASRRDNKWTLSSNSGQIVIYNACTIPSFDISVNSFIRLASATVSATGNSTLAENVFVASNSGINTIFTSTGTITKVSNNTTD